MRPTNCYLWDYQLKTLTEFLRKETLTDTG